MFILERVFFISAFNAILFLSFAQHTSGKEFHFARRIKTDDMTVYNFETLTGQSINGCIELCKRKKRCKFINYERRPNLCFLIGIQNEDFQIEDNLEVKPGFYFGDKNEWNMEELAVCEPCSENGVCKIDDRSEHSKCLNSGCGPPERKENTILLGGMFSVGSRIEYECKKGYKPIENVPLRSVCLENGTWSPVEGECMPACDEPPDVAGATLSGDGQVRQYTCDDDMYPLPEMGNGTIMCDKTNSSWIPDFSCGGLRLTEGQLSEMTITSLSGYLEMFAEGEWRALTVEDWTPEATKVACRKLFGTDSGGTFREDYNRLRLTKVSKLKDILCTGEEEALEQCEYNLKDGNENKRMALTCLVDDITVSDKHEFEGTSYKLIRAALNWKSAKAACSSFGGHLVDIKSKDEQKFITETITNVDNFRCYWTGGTRSNGGFIWLDGTVIDNEDIHWGPDQPNNAWNIQRCVVLSSKFDYKWNDRRCSVTCRVICEQIST